MTAPHSKRDLWYRRGVVAGAMSLTAAGIGLHATGVLAAKPHNGSAGPTCTVSASAAPSWLAIGATGLTPGGLYQVAVASPVGTTMGNSVYADSNGSFTDGSLPSAYSGAYSVTVSKFNGNTTLASCSTTVP